MSLDRWLGEASITNKSLSYKLKIIFALFFLAPTFGFLFFALKNDILTDSATPWYFLMILVFSLAGVMVLRRTFDRVSHMSRSLADRASSLPLEVHPRFGADELKVIAESFSAVEERLSATHDMLENKVSDLSVLKELADLCYVTLDPEEVLYMTLERALKLARADIGSVMLIDREDRDHFVVKASIGTGTLISIGDRIKFSTSIAKYAVMNKSPLVIENIETDSRFGRINRSQYGTKSFICMPIKTIRDIIGVITVSRRMDQAPFTTETADIISPLISNAAFTFENLRLMRERERKARTVQVLDRVSVALGSSLRGKELVQTILNEVRNEMGFQRAAVLIHDSTRTDELQLYDFYEPGDSPLKHGTRYSADTSFFEQVIRQGMSLVIHKTTDLPPSPEKDLLAGTISGSALIVPMRNDGTVMGVLILCGLKKEEAEGMRDFIKQVSSSLALAVLKNELSTTVARKSGELATLKQIGGVLASSIFDIDRVLSYTMDMIRNTMDAEAGSLLLVENNELVFAVAFGLDTQALKSSPLKLGQGISGYAAARGETVVVNDVKASSFFLGEIDSRTLFNTRSVLAVPLISQGRVIGVLKVLNKITDDFNDDDTRLLQSIASSVSIALENARLYRETLSLAEHEREVRKIFQKFVPKEVVEKIIHGTETGVMVHDEFRTLTLLNLDIRNFSVLARRIGPQKTVSLLNRFFSVMGEIVFENDGIVDKYLGDGFLALFGALVSSPSDADNAVRAALEMKEALHDLNKLLMAQFQVSLAIGVSIHTGEVVVGNIGFEKKMDYTVIGDSVNTLFRLQELTKQNTQGILMSEMTRRATQSHFNLREAGTITVAETPGGIVIFEVISDSVKFPGAPGNAVGH
ncbi:MAG: GAF domain-containing protein [Syntrophales bacterium]|jgi:adenylate cyclase|nr:GAF domain-containing protein [Syntrophales bacterium]MCK9527343.1 GAF domain-containing protein [Syntrophales bacterium]MDX9921187.1 GAF domain-containing protein [Syntrophales bacterium]